MRVLSLCSGIGGLDLAAEMAGMEVIGQVEIDPFCQAVLAKHWPCVTRLGDIKEVQGGEFGPIDLITAGFPCQPYSEAGKRLGREDPRYLWPEIARLICAVRPRWIVLENVPGLLTVESGRVFRDILWTLAQMGYDAGWGVYGAADVAAPQLRERVFIVAYTRNQSERGGQAWSGRSEDSDRRSPVADPTSQGWQGTIWAESSIFPNIARQSAGVGQADPSGARLSLWERTAGERPRASTSRSAARQAQSVLGRGVARLSNRLDRSRWPARPNEAQENWEPPRVVTERIPNRAARLKALGNAVVPAQAYPIFAAIMAAEQEAA